MGYPVAAGTGLYLKVPSQLVDVSGNNNHHRIEFLVN